MNREELNRFEKLFGLVQSLYDEVSLLSKKSPNDAVNKFKIQFVNSLLDTSNELLGNDYRPFDDFSSFDLDNLPTNSDVALIFSQYLQCFEKLRADNSVQQGSSWYWRIHDPDDPTADERGTVFVKTVVPRRLRG